MPTSLSRRLLWFVGIWLISVLFLSVVAYVIPTDDLGIDLVTPRTDAIRLPSDHERYRCIMPFAWMNARQSEMPDQLRSGISFALRKSAAR